MKDPAVRTGSTSMADSSPQEQSRPGSRNIKRKVMRKRNGESRVFDESFASTDSGKLTIIAISSVNVPKTLKKLKTLI